MIKKSISEKTFDVCFQILSKADISKYHLYKKDGWFNWGKTFADERNKVFGIFIQGNDEIQGVIAIQEQTQNQLIHIELLESAPQNKSSYPNRKFKFVGINLICLAMYISFQRGYDGYIGLEAKLNVNDNYYKELGAFCSRGGVPPYFFFPTKSSETLIQGFLPGGIQWCQI